jgi:hypothetical protein
VAGRSTDTPHSKTLAGHNLPQPIIIMRNPIVHFSGISVAENRLAEAKRSPGGERIRSSWYTFPKPQAKKPLCLKSSGRGMASGCSSLQTPRPAHDKHSTENTATKFLTFTHLKDVVKVYTCDSSGYRPVRNELRDGQQTAWRSAKDKKRLSRPDRYSRTATRPYDMPGRLKVRYLLRICPLKVYRPPCKTLKVRRHHLKIVLSMISAPY